MSLVITSEFPVASDFLPTYAEAECLSCLVDFGLFLPFKLQFKCHDAVVEQTCCNWVSFN